MTLLEIGRTNTILYCHRWQETVRFYRDLLGLSVSHATDWMVELKLNDHSFLSLADARRTTIPAGRGAGVTLTWQVQTIEDHHRRITALEMAPSPIAEKWNAHVFYFRDPDGHRIEFWSPLTPESP